jgi:uncharacterized protein
MDDFELREEAIRSPKSFLAKQESPIAIDEIQKAPELFDAIKLRVDESRVPGSFFLTGSAAFSSKIGIRESLTGRIGLLYLNPMTAGELHRRPFSPVRSILHPLAKARLDLVETMQAILSGGMPVPAFLRDPEERDQYWTSWLDTTLNRDLGRFVGRAYDADLAFALLRKIGLVLSDGDLPTLKHFAQPARKVRQYLSAMEEIFLLRRISCHDLGIGKDIWLLADSGLAAHLMNKTQGDAATLTLARHFLWNEWICQYEYQGKRFPRVYYKSAQGSPVDLVIDGVPIRIVAQSSDVTRHLKIEERPLLGAMKRLRSKVGYLVAPVEQAVLPKKGVGIVPWGAWS